MKKRLQAKGVYTYSNVNVNIYEQVLANHSRPHYDFQTEIVATHVALHIAFLCNNCEVYMYFMVGKLVMLNHRARP